MVTGAKYPTAYSRKEAFDRKDAYDEESISLPGPRESKGCSLAKLASGSIFKLVSELYRNFTKGDASSKSEDETLVGNLAVLKKSPV